MFLHQIDNTLFSRTATQFHVPLSSNTKHYCLGTVICARLGTCVDRHFLRYSGSWNGIKSVCMLQSSVACMQCNGSFVFCRLHKLFSVCYSGSLCADRSAVRTRPIHMWPPWISHCFCSFDCVPNMKLRYLHTTNWSIYFILLSFNDIGIRQELLILWINQYCVRKMILVVVAPLNTN